ncbi:type II toxin-antitoxin system RelE family toxin [Anaerotaenia torta]|uniref:type II toxin-antitoxin system RelE family toxin n=1 Tax=Anaerotaenia torta TaxID=433293 RepID=UPI003D1AD824
MDILQIEYSKSAVKAINSMDKSTKQRIKLGIEGLTTQPPTGDIKPLQGYSDNHYRLRIGGYRIIYKHLMDNSVVVLYIMDIGSRGDIYK